MGVVWKGGLCVENQPSDSRAAIMLDCVEEARQDWHASYLQQKAIERVGWTCLRIDVLTFLADTKGTMDWVEKFLFAAGVQPAINVGDDVEDDMGEDHDDDPGSNHAVHPGWEDDKIADIDAVVALAQERQNAAARRAAAVAAVDPPAVAADRVDSHDDAFMLVSSDEEGANTKPSAKPDPAWSSDFRTTAATAFDTGPEQLDPSNFGAVVDLDFLRGGIGDDNSSLTGEDWSLLLEDGDTQSASPSPNASRRRAATKRKARTTMTNDNDESEAADMEAEDVDWLAADDEEDDDYDDNVAPTANALRLRSKRQRKTAFTTAADDATTG
jgi:hypothetical protein